MEHLYCFPTKIAVTISIPDDTVIAIDGQMDFINKGKA